MPKISVVMPAYNAEKYIREAIDSILNQTFNDFEFIIINDGSTDNTKQIIKSYNDSRIVYLENEKNSGIVYTLNKGLEYAKGEYIARMDSDDISMPNRFEKQIKYMEKNNDVVVLGTSYKIFGNNVNERKIYCETDDGLAKAELIFSPCVAHPTVMIRKSIIDQNHIRYDNSYIGTEDYSLWWKLVQYGKILSLPDILHYYRIHDKQITKKNDETSVKIFKNFVDERMKLFNIFLSFDEKTVFFEYTNGQSKNFKLNEILIFSKILKKIKLNNKKVKFFENNSINTKISRVSLECLYSELITNNEKIKLFLFMIKNKLLTIHDIISFIWNYLGGII